MPSIDRAALTKPASRLTAFSTQLEGVGLQSAGRLLALNSYENRVYQIGIHAFVAEAVGHEIPVVAPLALGRSNRKGEEIEIEDIFI